MALSRTITANSPTDLSMLTKFLRCRVGARVVMMCQPSDKKTLTAVPSGVIFASDTQAAVTLSTLDLVNGWLLRSFLCGGLNHEEKPLCVWSMPAFVRLW
jgi:hypothetical protein